MSIILDGTNGININGVAINATGGTYYSNQYLMTGITSSNTETEIFIGGVANSRIGIVSSNTIYYNIDVMTIRTGDYAYISPECATFYIKGAIRNIGGTVSDIGNLYEVVVTRSDAAFLVDSRANNIDKSLSVYVKGKPSINMKWTAIVTTMEL